MMTAKILIVEDEPALMMMLEAAMEIGGFDSRSVSSGRDALAAIGAERFDAILLDLGLPDMDGRRILGSIRGMSDVPILIVSGRGSERDKVEALDQGADDYIAKPFLPAELLARIRAVLRRRSDSNSDGSSESGTPPPLAPNALVLDSNYCVARFGGREVSLSEQEFKVADLLVRTTGGPVSRSDILEAFYGEGQDRHTKIVEIYLMRLRRKLQQLTGRDDVIQNFRGRGWALRLG